MWQLVFALHHRLIPQEEQEQDAKMVPAGHGRSFGPGQWQKQSLLYCLCCGCLCCGHLCCGPLVAVIIFGIVVFVVLIVFLVIVSGQLVFNI